MQLKNTCCEAQSFATQSDADGVQALDTKIDVEGVQALEYTSIMWWIIP